MHGMHAIFRSWLVVNTHIDISELAYSIVRYVWEMQYSTTCQLDTVTHKSRNWSHTKSRNWSHQIPKNRHSNAKKKEVKASRKYIRAESAKVVWHKIQTTRTTTNSNGNKMSGNGFDENPFGEPNLDNPFAVSLTTKFCWWKPYTHSHSHAYTHAYVYVYSPTKLWDWVYVLCVCVCLL